MKNRRENSSLRAFKRGTLFKVEGVDLGLMLVGYDGDQAIMAEWTEANGYAFSIWSANNVNTENGLKKVTDHKTGVELLQLLLDMEPAV